ncbi:MAG: DNA alkylation repair protein [Clostridia bacterium]|nr:DNA alkylation repair protein [Clostridia bacterium]
MKTYESVVKDLLAITNRRTADVDRYNKLLIKDKEDVSQLKDFALSNQMVHRTYFQVSLGLINSVEQQFLFIEQNEDLLQDWWHVDQLTQFIKRPVDFSFALSKAQQYIASSKPFVRRWGYVLFLVGLQKDRNYTEQILSLMKDDDEYYVQMAEAWLIADLAVFNVEAVKSFLQTSKLKYNILGKATQKMCDSFRISQQDKAFVKSLRIKLKDNG